MSAPESAEAIRKLFDEHVVGRNVRAFAVHAVNSLKTTDPPLTDLAGQRIARLSLGEPSCFILHLESFDVTVNLERTGRLRWIPSLEPWLFAPGATPPTARLLLDDGSGIDFKEPGRTKRITFSVAATGT